VPQKTSRENSRKTTAKLTAAELPSVDRLSRFERRKLFDMLEHPPLQTRPQLSGVGAAITQADM